MKKIFLLMLLVGSFTAAFSQQAPSGDSTLQQYAGKYKFPEGSVVAEVTVILDGGNLTMSSPVGTSPLEKKEEDVFVITQFQGTAKFNRDASKKIIGVTINAGGYLLEGTRTEEGFTFQLAAQNTRNPLLKGIIR
ncbi:MAG: hypothetical protein EBX50_10685 [Chitinophagia bacterium]|nr:hypothetical protein [Chitinophagia bacterium]